MSETRGRWTAYVMLLFIAALVAAGKIQRFDSLWLAFFASMLMLPASVGRSGNRQDRAEGLDPKGESPVAATSGETPDLSTEPPPQ